MSLSEYQTLQPKVMKMLLNSYHKKRLAHAYIFEGEKGTKKKAVALEFAKLLYCEAANKPCGECINCLRIEHNNHPNVLVIEAENNTIKKEQILYLQQEYSKTTLEPGPKFYVIEDIEKMSINASNSILKFIEEPQSDTYTILTTENIHQILPTIISRCQVLNFHPIPKQEMREYLVKNQVEKYLASICAQLTNDLEEAQGISQDEDLINVIDLVTTLIKAMVINSENLLVIYENSKVDLKNNKKLLNYFLDLMLLLMRDFKRVENNHLDLVFINEESFIKTNIDKIATNKILENINLILKTKIHLEYNANTGLLIDHLLINLM